MLYNHVLQAYQGFQAIGKLFFNIKKARRVRCPGPNNMLLTQKNLSRRLLHDRNMAELFDILNIGIIVKIETVVADHKQKAVDRDHVVRFDIGE